MQDQVRRRDTTATEEGSSGGEAAAASEDDALETFSPISSLIRGPEQEAELRDRIRLARSAAAATELEPCSTITALGSTSKATQAQRSLLHFTMSCAQWYMVCAGACVGCYQASTARSAHFLNDVKSGSFRNEVRPFTHLAGQKVLFTVFPRFGS